jgi:hypothetical protein
MLIQLDDINEGLIDAVVAETLAHAFVMAEDFTQEQGVPMNQLQKLQLLQALVMAGQSAREDFYSFKDGLTEAQQMDVSAAIVRAFVKGMSTLDGLLEFSTTFKEALQDPTYREQILRDLGADSDE